MERHVMFGYPRPYNEAARLEALRRYAILDSAPEDPYDNLVQVAANLCEVPVAAGGGAGTHAAALSAASVVTVASSSRPLRVRSTMSPPPRAGCPPVPIAVPTSCNAP